MHPLKSPDPGAIFAKEKKARTGIIVRDYGGNCITWRADWVSNPEEAEMRAVSMVVKWRLKAIVYHLFRLFSILLPISPPLVL
ncbi:hypothetical protein CDL12_24774 [Handroanthus impetiginosus]|uniref:Uncharacterized protein n=1 Tax=Handroanthus impetiginosus TaxID=429701 RepID=A0A2G9GCK2_9LAMI|nr:hypothetical protein CDL12_24774 [Handroanthus impetiginosus]